MAAISLKVAEFHMAKKLQPDCISAYWHYLDACHVGPAVFHVQELKIGKVISTLKITVYQHHLLAKFPWITSNSKALLFGIIVSGNITKELGPTINTSQESKLGPQPVFSPLLLTQRSPDWKLLYDPGKARIPLLRHFECYALRKGPESPGTDDFWIRLVSGQRFENSSLALVADVGQHFLLESVRLWDVEDESRNPFRKISLYNGMRFPTIRMVYEMKQSLNPGGEEWLQLRFKVVQLKMGRWTGRIVIMNQNQDLVAMSSQVAFVISPLQKKAAIKGNL